jgi:hypothetical protein
MRWAASARERFRAALMAPAKVGPGSPSAIDAEFVASLLAFGSETEDNMSCVERVGIRRIPGGYGSQVIGLAMRSRDTMVAEILNAAEGSEVPATVLEALPGLEQADWDAVLRLATMILVSLEVTADEVQDSA